ncbi:putative ankyrin repeat-containing protein [Xylogone sp. PMI_703]|nr:putative ankyrin repeat-containing protein [Xylogone sp. PMI_703]
MGWEHLYMRLLPACRSLPEYPLKLVQRLVEDLEGVSASFRTISCSFDVVNFYESGQHPVDETNIGFDCRHEELWTFIRSNPIAEEACNQIYVAINNALRPVFTQSRFLDWIYGKEEFKSWKNDPLVRLLRISGPSGSGTTVITAQIIGALLDQHSVCLSFAFDKNDIRARTPFSFYLSLCRQILSSRPQLFQHVSSALHFLTKYGVFTAESFWVIARCLMERLMDNPGTSVFCVIDAVDECIESQVEVIQRMESFVGLANHHFKLLLSGTMLPGMASKSNQHRGITLGSDREGILSSKKEYVQNKIREFTLENSAWYGLDDVAVGQLETLPADSPYLLLKLNVSLLGWTCRNSTRKDLKRKLREQPATLDDFYSHAIEAIGDANRNWVTKALCWIAHAVRPLRPTELAVAVALDDIPKGPPWESGALEDISDLIRRDIVRDLRHFMAPLIEVEDNRIYLIHDTFRVFLQNIFAQTQTENPTSAHTDCLTQTEAAQHELAQHNSASDEHFRILLHCLEYLKSFGLRGSASFICKDGTSSPLPTDQELSLLSYASLHWPRHFLQTTSRTAAYEFVLQFLQDDKRVEIWANLYHQLKSSLRSNGIRLDDPLKIVCNFGLTELVDDCINLTKSSEDVSDQLQKSLDLAAQNGHNDIVQKLLKLDVRSSEALGLAAAEGFKSVVKSLLTIDSDINTLDGMGYAPLHHATCGGHKDIVLLLLAYGADPNVPTSTPTDYQSATSTQRKYFDRDSDFDSDSDVDESERESTTHSYLLWSGTSLHLAALTGQYEIAKILLAHGADVSKKNSFGYNPLKYVAIGGFPELLMLLLQHQANDGVSDSDGNTALHLAAAYGHFKAAEILLQKSSDSSKLIHTINSCGLSPIHIAAREGHLSLLNLMVGVEDKNKDAESIASTDREGWYRFPATPITIDNPLSNPRFPDPKKPTRRSTLEASPERKSQTSSTTPAPLTTSKDHHKSALEWAAKSGHDHIVRAILARSDGSNREERAFSLNWAAQNGHTNIVMILLDGGLTETATDAYQNTALHLAAKGGHSETLTKLLTHSRGKSLFQIDATEKKGMTPLHLAARAGHKKNVEILLTHGATANLTNKSRTALHLAAANGHLAVVKRLCAFKDIIWMKDKSHLTAFDLVVNRNDIEEVEKFIQILEDTADDGTFARGGSPLHVVAEHNNIDVLRLLLKNGWGCDAKDDNGATPLHRAVQCRFLHGIEILLQNPLCDITAQDDYGYTVMHYASTPELVNHLLNAGVENDLKDNRKRTPLFLAAYGGNLAVVQALLNSIPKPDVHTKDDDDWTLLHAAYDSPPITELLLNPEHGVGPDALSTMAIRWNQLESAKLLLEANADPNLAYDFKNLPLCLACGRENALELIQLLVNNKTPADILAKDSEGNTALHIAVQKGKHAEVEYLIRELAHIKSSEIDNIYASALSEILVSKCLDGSIDAVNINVSGSNYGTALYTENKGADINFVEETQPTALQRATSQPNTTLINLLLSKGADVNLTGGDLDTPLNAAIRGGPGIDGQLPIHTMILAGADPLSRDSDGRSALMHGIVNRNLSMVYCLLTLNAFDASDTDAKDQTPLIIATMLGSNSIVTMLLELGHTNYEGKTALLLESGADPRIVDCRGHGPLYWAARAARRMITLDTITAVLEKYEGYIIEPWNVAVHGATLLRLLEKEDIDAEYAEPDGRYESYRMEYILQEEAGRPFPGLELGSDGATLNTVGGTKFKNLGQSSPEVGAARTDYPMLPLFKDKIFYFEIEITKAAEKGDIAVGFCDDQVPLHRSWGFHSDDGRVYDGCLRSWEGYPYGIPYAAGEVIGCGVNFAENSAFYTRGGEVIGRAFEDIRGKLYPAVSMDITQKGWEIRATFPDSNGTSPHFKFKGDFESSETLRPPVIEENSTSDVNSGSEIVQD